MQRFTLAARIYIWAVIALGVVVLTWSAWMEHLEHHDSLFMMVAGCATVIVASQFKVTLFRAPKNAQIDETADRNVVTMSLGYVPTFLMFFYMGPLPGCLAAVCNSAAASRKAPYFKRFFNAAMLLVSAFAAICVLRPFGLAPGGWDPLTLALTGRLDTLLLPLLGIFLATSVYYLVNTGLVTAVIALTSQQSPFEVWRKQFLWAAPAYYAGASCAAVILAILPHVFGGFPNHLAVFAFLLVALPVPTVIFLVYRYHSQLDEANQGRIEALRLSAEELERKNEELQRGRDDLQTLFTSTVESLALAIDAKDRSTKEHIQRVKGFAVAIAEEMGLTGDALNAVETGALLHDIGKLAVPEHILTKPGRLSEEEFAKVKAHPDMGARILEPVKFPFPVMPIVRSHHERWDGKGYPDGLSGESIPLGGRILAVADVYDALTSDRAYRQGWPHERAITHLCDHAGSHFDPQVVDAFLAVLVRDPGISTRFGTGVAASSLGAVRGTAGQDTAAEGINRASFEYLAIYEISQVVAATLNLSETLALIAERIRNLFNATTCVLLLKETEIPDLSGAGSIASSLFPSNLLRVRYAVGEQSALFDGASVNIGMGETGKVAETGKGLLTNYHPDDLDLPGSLTISDEAEEPFRSVIVAPLVADGLVVGTVNLYHKRPHAFDQEDLRVLQEVAIPAGRAIQNAVEYDRTLESALTDSLTGLHNARHLHLFLARELERARNEERVLTVLVLDLDNFKPVNDLFGHSRGNEVLRDLGRIFQSTLRGGDLVARYAGDEFVIVLPGTGSSEVRYVIDKIHTALRTYDPRPSDADLARLEIGVSIGAATYPDDGTDPQALINTADRAMFEDKNMRKGLRPSESANVLRLVA